MAKQGKALKKALKRGGFVEAKAPDFEAKHLDFKDAVHHPSHYNQGEIECIEFIEDQGHGKSYTVGNAMKYITRAGHKGDELEDLRKGIWYAMRRAEQVKAEREKRKPIRPNAMPKVPV